MKIHLYDVIFRPAYIPRIFGFRLTYTSAAYFTIRKTIRIQVTFDETSPA